MSSVLSKIRLDQPSDTEPRLLEVGDEDTLDVLAVLSGEMRNRIFEALHDHPASPSELADRLETSLQNVHYHLDKLESVGLIESAGIQYSEKGKEMTIYAPANDPIVLVGTRPADRELRDVLKRWAGAVGLVLIAGVLVQIVVNQLIPSGSSNVGPAWASGVAEAPRAVLLWGLEPGLLVILGGLLVIGFDVFRHRFVRR